MTVFLDNKPYTVQKTDKNFEGVKEAITAKSINRLRELLDKPKTVEEFTEGKVKILDGVVFYDKVRLGSRIVQRLLDYKREGFDFKPMSKFLAKLARNPSESARDELLLFIEAGDMPICEDGDFLAYKRVRDNYRDFWTGKYRHFPGDKPSMPRSSCDSNRHNTCSEGFHICTHQYLPEYHGGQGKIMVLKASPEHVVAVPPDYNASKMRVCRYEVLSELGKNPEKRPKLTKKLYRVKKNGKIKAVAPKRDRTGRFAKHRR